MPRLAKVIPVIQVGEKRFLPKEAPAGPWQGGPAPADQIPGGFDRLPRDISGQKKPRHFSEMPKPSFGHRKNRCGPAAKRLPQCHLALHAGDDKESVHAPRSYQVSARTAAQAAADIVDTVQIMLARLRAGGAQ